jgi:acyl-CoA thioester hydrolase
MPDFKFSTPIEVRYSDLDAQRHLNHAKYFSFMEQARCKYIMAVGL